MNRARLLKVLRPGPGLLLEALVVAAFFLSFWWIATLTSPLSTWTMAPCLLLNFALLCWYLRHIAQGSPLLYLGHFDTAVFILFAAIVANVYYSEILPVSYRQGALLTAGLAGYVLGRCYFVTRLRVLAIGMLLASLLLLITGSIREAALVRDPEADAFQIGLVRSLLSFAFFHLIFWAIALPMLSVRKPTNLLIFIAVLLGLAAIGLQLMVGFDVFRTLFSSRLSADVVTQRHEAGLLSDTLFRIFRNFPLVGTGIGTLPIVFRSYVLTPSVPSAAAAPAWIQWLVETGAVGAIVALYLFITFLLYLVRRWSLFPNRRLRLAVVLFFFFVAAHFVEWCFASWPYTVVGWFGLMTTFGVLVGLTMVRDPMRVFETPVEGAAPGLNPVMVGDEISALEGVERARSYRRGQMHVRVGLAQSAAGFMVAFCLVAISIAQALPYVASRMSRRAETEDLADPAYGQRVERAARLAPFLPEIQSRLAAHYNARVRSPLDMAQDFSRIETALNKAITLNPYEPRLYEQLSYLYSDTNNPAKALEVLKTGVATLPNHFGLRMSLVRALERGGNTTLAAFHTRQALFRTDPDNADLMLRLAEIYSQRDMRETAVRFFQYADQVLQTGDEAEARLQRLRAQLQID